MNEYPERVNNGCMIYRNRVSPTTNSCGIVACNPQHTTSEDGAVTQGTPLRRTGRLKPRSKRMDRIYRDRRKLVVEMLTEHPVCQRCGNRRSVDVHEVKSRGRGGSILDRKNCRAVCRECHDWIGENPKQAEDEGWLVSQWQPTAE